MMVIQIRGAVRKQRSNRGEQFNWNLHVAVDEIRGVLRDSAK